MKVKNPKKKYYKGIDINRLVLFYMIICGMQLIKITNYYFLIKNLQS